MEKANLRRTAGIAVIWLFILAAILVTATYAWFTFSPDTNVTPMSSTISNGGASLLISNEENGTFDKTCALTPEGTDYIFNPVSTADLTSFFSDKAQNRKGISTLFKDVTQQVNENMMHGKVYLKCENGDCDVYFYRSGLAFGEDTQALAALRLGLNITTTSGQHTYIFRLDEMGDTASAESAVTITEEGSVIASIDEGGEASFVQDPSLEMTEYLTTETSADDTEPGAGNTALCRLTAGETAEVEYWLYLEGCDSQCIGVVQEKDIDLQLAFAGAAVTAEQ